MFWLGTGPRTSDTALGSTLGHDKHNIWVVGSSDAAMAMVANALAERLRMLTALPISVSHRDVGRADVFGSRPPSGGEGNDT